MACERLAAGHGRLRRCSTSNHQLTFGAERNPLDDKKGGITVALEVHRSQRRFRCVLGFAPGPPPTTTRLKRGSANSQSRAAPVTQVLPTIKKTLGKNGNESRPRDQEKGNLSKQHVQPADLHPVKTCPPNPLESKSREINFTAILSLPTSIYK